MEQDIFSLLYPSGYTAKEEDGFTDFSFIKNLGIDSMIFLKRESRSSCKALRWQWEAMRLEAFITCVNRLRAKTSWRDLRPRTLAT